MKSACFHGILFEQPEKDIKKTLRRSTAKYKGGIHLYKSFYRPGLFSQPTASLDNQPAEWGTVKAVNIRKRNMRCFSVLIVKKVIETASRDKERKNITQKQIWMLLNAL